MALNCSRKLCFVFMRHCRQSSVVCSFRTGRTLNQLRQISAINGCTTRKDQTFAKHYTTEAESRTYPDIDEIKTDPAWIARLFGEDTDKHVVSDAEREERESLYERVKDMYFAEPPIHPDAAFYKEAFELLMKYNDKDVVEVIWDLSQEMGIEFDEEFICKLEDFLRKAREEAWFK